MSPTSRKGVGAGATAAELTGSSFYTVTTALAASVGTLQLGWFWLAYALGLAQGRPRWPLVAAAAATAPLAAWLAWIHVTT